ncbi:RNA N6-adenosine-methyltransferase mettl16-like isoform X3 [Panicum virgatum]|uniref:RNA N6-adenosine-methyltransferase mettl16-like isoform X3 n=1 Tax=Panicum virgatum TaxID=38727 RepID=UPI0019D5AA76|nr:RNA N6-adenosine-methyltransferase mettl16-like isoform X3 [Panicum virgatum]
MGGGRKRRRDGSEAPSIHPRNRYAAAAPDFAALAELYPSFRPFVSVSERGRASVDFTDFSATRELTRVLLLHDHGVNWWIPDGQLCPTVPNRSNYIHWIEDLLSSNLIPPVSSSSGRVRGFDIGTGANCIYPLLGASLLGWSFVGSDVTDVALEWAKKNVENNPQLAELIEIRNANAASLSAESEAIVRESIRENVLEPAEDVAMQKPPVLVGVVKESESFDFCVCNPPFFESIEEAGLNPKTSCGGTAEEMVCPGGELAFVTQIIEDSVSLKNSFRWFTSMVGRKANLKLLMSKARKAGASVVKTTDFVQGQTARWGLAWSFIAPRNKVLRSSTPAKNHHSFMLQVTLSDDQTEAAILHGDDYAGSLEESSAKLKSVSKGVSFRITVFEQIPGTLLIKGSLLNKALSGTFSSSFSELEDTLRMECLSKTR